MRTWLPLTIDEATFQRTVVETALRFRCMVHHSRPARMASGRWVTPITGHPGLPDLIIARDGWVVLAELKRHGGRLSPGQRRWAEALGVHSRIWSPADFPRIVVELRDGPGA